jgi:uncharacterized membrane protein YqjE
MSDLSDRTTTGSTGATAVSAADLGGARSGSAEPSTAELVTRLSQQSTELIRNELKLAQAEMTEKAKHAGVGIGLFGGAGVIALYGVGALIATVILVLVAIGLPPWLSALIVTVVLFVIAGVAALIGKKQVSQATPAAPEQTIDSVKRDVDTIKEARR